MPTVTRTCKHCGETKPLDDKHFLRVRKARDSFYGICKPCRYAQIEMSRKRNQSANRNVDPPEPHIVLRAYGVTPAERCVVDDAVSQLRTYLAWLDSGGGSQDRPPSADDVISRHTKDLVRQCHLLAVVAAIARWEKLDMRDGNRRCRDKRWAS